VFAYDDAVATLYPMIRAGAILAAGPVRWPAPPALLDEYRPEQRAASGGLQQTALAELPQIAAWRRVSTRFGAPRGAPYPFRSAHGARAGEWAS
jgi:hypothetical protein